MSFNAFFWHAGVHVVRALIHNLLKKKIGLGQQEGTCGQACLDSPGLTWKTNSLKCQHKLKNENKQKPRGVMC